MFRQENSINFLLRSANFFDWYSIRDIIKSSRIISLSFKSIFISFSVKNCGLKLNRQVNYLKKSQKKLSLSNFWDSKICSTFFFNQLNSIPTTSYFFLLKTSFKVHFCWQIFLYQIYCISSIDECFSCFSF